MELKLIKPFKKKILMNKVRAKRETMSHRVTPKFPQITFDNEYKICS